MRNVGRGAPGCGEWGARAVTGRARGGSLGGCPASAWGSGCRLPESVPLVTVQLAVHWIPIKIYTKNKTKNAWFSPSLQQQEKPKSLQPVVIPPSAVWPWGKPFSPLWLRFPSAELRAQAVQQTHGTLLRNTGLRSGPKPGSVRTSGVALLHLARCFKNSSL